MEKICFSTFLKIFHSFQLKRQKTTKKNKILHRRKKRLFNKRKTKKMTHILNSFQTNFLTD